MYVIPSIYSQTRKRFHDPGDEQTSWHPRSSWNRHLLSASLPSEQESVPYRLSRCWCVRLFTIRARRAAFHHSKKPHKHVILSGSSCSQVSSCPLFYQKRMFWPEKLAKIERNQWNIRDTCRPCEHSIYGDSRESFLFTLPFWLCSLFWVLSSFPATT